MAEDFWKRCNSCKNTIAYSAQYWVCNVSTCNRKRTGLVFCNVSCWDAHLPLMNHRESWAEERSAPSREQWARTLAGEEEKPRAPRKTSETAATAQSTATQAPVTPQVILRRSSNK